MPSTPKPQRPKGSRRRGDSSAAYDQKLELARREFVYASELPGLAHDLATGRPIAGRAWNSFAAAISAKTELDYVNALRDVAAEVIRELDPTGVTQARLDALQEVARGSERWPMMYGPNKSVAEEMGAAATTLRLGANDGRSRRPVNEGPIPALASNLLKHIRDKIRQHQSLSLHPKRRWPFYYVCDPPPRYDKSAQKEWCELASVVLDIYYGPEEIRTTARNLYQERDLENRHFPDGHKIATHTDVLKLAEDQRPKAKRPEVAAWKRWDKKQRSNTAEKDRSGKMSAPSILRFPEFSDYGRQKKKGKASAGEASAIDSLQTDRAIYNQIKKDVLKAVVNRLPK